MGLRELALGAPWMSDKEHIVAKKFVAGLRRFFKQRGVAENPLIVLRVEDLCFSLLLARRAEEALPTENEITKKTSERTPSAIEVAGRARERLRKAMKELEEACAKLGTPVDTGLADRMKSIMQRSVGVIEEITATRNAPPDSDGE
jgi:hypothetical protein